VGRNVALHRLWCPGDDVLVAVSGGADSMALLDLLRETARWHGGRLRAATVDHGGRAGSGADADFAVDRCSAWGIPCTRIEVRPRRRSEAALREVRYAALRELGADVIATAHHRDDQAETVLIHLMRGATLAGLASIAWRYDGVVRPLLDVSRAELRAWLVWRGVPFREDPTNAARDRLRNRLRHEVLPLMEEIRPGAGAALARTATRAAALVQGTSGA
jgi:tRNA(Ile)-lysidine synthase